MASKQCLVGCWTQERFEGSQPEEVKAGLSIRSRGFTGITGHEVSGS
jgi:hypothetical protein